MELYYEKFILYISFIYNIDNFGYYYKIYTLGQVIHIIQTRVIILQFLLDFCIISFEIQKKN